MRPSRPTLGRSSFLRLRYSPSHHRHLVVSRSARFSVRLSSSFSFSPPDRPVSQSGKPDPAWTRVGRISRAAHHSAAGTSASAAAASPRPVANSTSRADHGATCLGRSPFLRQLLCQVSALRIGSSQEPQFPHRIPLRSSTSNAFYLIPLIAAALVIYNLTSGISPNHLNPEDERAYPQFSDAALDDEMATALPGRPGNLTPEEEDKLRRFWEMFLQICGVFDEDGAEGETPATLAEQQKTMTAGSDKDKKENKAAEKDAATTAVPKENDPEDKWGEGKAYHETLAKHTPEEIRATIWSMVKHDNPDALLLRFLRARKWDLQRALVMMVSTMSWRASEMRVDTDVMVKGEEQALMDEQSSDEAVKKQGEDFLAQMRLGKSYCYGVDKAGRPICVCRAWLHKAGEQSEASLERYTVYLIETTRFLLSPPVDTGVRPPYVTSACCPST